MVNPEMLPMGTHKNNENLPSLAMRKKEAALCIISFNIRIKFLDNNSDKHHRTELLLIPLVPTKSQWGA